MLTRLLLGFPQRNEGSHCSIIRKHVFEFERRKKWCPSLLQLGCLKFTSSCGLLMLTPNTAEVRNARVTRPDSPLYTVSTESNLQNAAFTLHVSVNNKCPTAFIYNSVKIFYCERHKHKDASFLHDMSVNNTETLTLLLWRCRLSSMSHSPANLEIKGDRIRDTLRLFALYVWRLFYKSKEELQEDVKLCSANPERTLNRLGSASLRLFLLLHERMKHKFH